MRRAIIASACIVTAGCVTSHMQRLDPEVRPPRAPESIVVLDQAPDQPYMVIARVESKTDAVFKGFDDLRAKVIDQASRLGGEAVIIGPETTETAFIILPTGMIPSEKKKLTAEVIVFSVK